MAVSDIQSGVYASLANVARFFVEKMKQKIDDVGAPRKIKDHVSVDSPIIGDTESYVDIVIDTSQKGAPMAGAFEWGSGIHGEKGERYQIPTKIGKPLAIPRERWSNYVPPPDKDPVILMKVLHPGVVAKPYIEPTIRENLSEIKKMLASGFKQAIISGVEKVVIIE